MSIAEPEANSEFLTEFLADYFAESDEHLTNARRNLLALERFVDQPRIDRALLDELFRSFHSLKGISGMVGAQEAEQLAHQMESYLRALREGQLALTTEGMDALIVSTRLMEQIIAEQRAPAPATDIRPAIERIAAIVSGAGPMNTRSTGDSRTTTAAAPGALNPDEAAQIAAAIESGQRIWRFGFAPLPELVQRGINVNVVRARLQEIGQLIIAAPHITPDGGIAFEFIVASSADGTAFAAWRDDGLTYAAYEGAPPAPHDRSGKESLSPAAPSLIPSNVVRVDLGRLDDLMRLVGELVISRSRLDDCLQRLEGEMSAPEWRPLQETTLAMERQLRDLREGVMRVRMAPIGEIFERMRFVVRDLAREHQKTVTLALSGQKTEIDKLLVDRMMDPILHLARNAVSHGLEPPDERVAKGKPPEGKISLRAFASAEMIVIEIEDDGRGIDATEVARRAHATGLISGDRGEAPLDSALLLDLICAPGFSTRDQADRASGRGVGMNAVMNRVGALGGSIEVDTELGRGTRFMIRLPLTLAIADALIVSVSGQRFAVPQSAVREVMEVDLSAVKALENNEIISHRGGVLPLLRLARLFRLDETPRNAFHVFVVGSGVNSVGIAVDRILGRGEIVVRAISDPLIEVPGIAGATELGDGHIVLILDAAALARAGRKAPGESKADSLALARGKER